MKFLKYFFYFCGSFLPSWIRIRNPNTDPDPLTRLNSDPIRIRIRNPGSKKVMPTTRCSTRGGAVWGPRVAVGGGGPPAGCGRGPSAGDGRGPAAGNGRGPATGNGRDPAAGNGCGPPTGRGCGKPAERQVLGRRLRRLLG
jgi:hypothetical protein